MRILLSILFCVFIANATAPKGAVVTQSVTINSAYVSESSTDFLLQFKVPRAGDILANCTSAANVAMTNLNDTLRRARWVVYTADTLYVYAHVAKSTSANTVYRLHYGKTLNEVNSSSTFTNCGIQNAYGFNESSPIDMATGRRTTKTGTAQSEQPDIFGKSVYNNGGIGYFTLADNNSQMDLTGATSYEVVTKQEASGSYLRFFRGYGITALSVNTSGGITITRNNFANTLHTGISVIGQTVHYVATIDAGNNGNTYLNGSKNASSGPLPQGTMDLSATLLSNGGSSASIGYVGEFFIYKSVVSSGYILDRYSTLFTSTFWTLGTPLATTSITGSRRSGYRQVNMGQGMH